MEKSKQFNLKKQIQRSLIAKIIDEYAKKIIIGPINEINVNKASKLKIKPLKLNQKAARSSIE